tara:strand:+ start:2625 stop:3257 length:633 start_codon:yes stop_codon:yes gene_type:complete
MSDILRQVDEELRQDRLLDLWKSYRLYLIGGLILIICSVIGYQIDKSVKSSLYEELVEKYISTSDLDDLEKSIKTLVEIGEYNQSLISGIAKIKIANLLMENGNSLDGRNTLLEVINDNNSEQIVNDLAIYLYLMNDLKGNQQDEISKYLTNEKIESSSLKYLYRELIAINDLLLGNNKLSIENFNKLINDSNTPRDIVIRANKFVDSIK